MCRRMVCDCENPTVDLFCCPECDPRLSSQCLHQNGETLYNSGDTWVQNCQQCRCLVSLATGSTGAVPAQNLRKGQSCPPTSASSQHLPRHSAGSYKKWTQLGWQDGRHAVRTREGTSWSKWRMVCHVRLSRVKKKRLSWHPQSHSA